MPSTVRGLSAGITAGGKNGFAAKVTGVGAGYSFLGFISGLQAMKPIKTRLSKNKRFISIL
jgi:mevalonate kinase